MNINLKRFIGGWEPFNLVHQLMLSRRYFNLIYYEFYYSKIKMRHIFKQENHGITISEIQDRFLYSFNFET